MLIIFWPWPFLGPVTFTLVQKQLLKLFCKNLTWTCIFKMMQIEPLIIFQILQLVNNNYQLRGMRGTKRWGVMGVEDPFPLHRKYELTKFT